MRLVPALLLLIGLVTAAWSAPRPGVPAFHGVAVPTATAAPAAAEPARRIELPQDQPSAHASSLALASDGGVLVAWFAGTREGAADVRIEMLKVGPGTERLRWTALTREQLQAGVRRSIRKLGNPSICRDSQGILHLFVVSVSVGGWSGSAINHMTSTDDGRTWSVPRRLILSPLLNFSSLVRAPAIALADGGLGLPAYHECVTKWPVWARLDAQGSIVGADRMPQPGPALQPAVAALSSESAVAVLRRGRGSPPQVLSNRTGDAGASWAAAPDTGVPNPDSGVALLRLADGTLMMACNPLESGRHLLQLFLSKDGGASWTPSAVIERGNGGEEFSYPSLLQDSRGTVHLSYTRNRTAIVLNSFSVTQAAEAPK
jgi:predicted neuraminidase